MGLSPTPVLKTSSTCGALDYPARLCPTSLASSHFPDFAGFGRRASSSLAPQRLVTQDSEQWIYVFAPAFNTYDQQLLQIVLFQSTNQHLACSSLFFCRLLHTVCIHCCIHSVRDKAILGGLLACCSSSPWFGSMLAHQL